MKKLYFGYGSNLNAKDWSEWCLKRGYEKSNFEDSFKKVMNAWLPDYQARFTVYSPSREGGVLDIVEAPGMVTPGVLFEVDDEAIELLDRKEGAPGFYRRIEVVVQTAKDFRLAFTYQVVSPEEYVQPTEEYLQVVCDGLKEHGLGDEHIRLASRGEEQIERVKLFVYGTLRSGEPFSEDLSECPREPWQVSGRLYNLGGFPGMYLDVQAQPVFGELVTIPPDLLGVLDKIEGFEGYHSSSLYYRVWLPKEIWGDNGGCWAYDYAQPENEMNEEDLILTGDWCHR